MALPARSKAVDLSDSDFEFADAPREFDFSDADFRHLVQLAYEHAGIALSDSKRNLVYSRLSRRLRALNMQSFREYRGFLTSSEGAQEIVKFINSISTNLTKLFRESHHFDHFRSHVAVPYSKTPRFGAAERLRVWSAGCSTGEEPYTIAVVLAREIRDIAARDVRVLATDIDTDVLAKASRGEYQANSLDDIPKAYRDLFPVSREDETGGLIQIGQPIRDIIAFRHLNLMQAWPFRGLFDAIFCRNVMIYFDSPTKANLIERFTQQIKPGGWLYIGHSESLNGHHPGLQLVGRTIYRRSE
jgi:chemotaxis protein methyltransferase CheR